jgi:zinc protease
LVIHRPGAAQAEIRVGRPALARTENGVFPAIVLNRVFGGQFTSRLNAVLREKKGLTYGIHSTFSFNRMPGPFSIATSVDSDRAADAIEMLDGELAKVAAGGISSGELSLAQRGIAGGFALALEHLAQIASIIDLIVLHDLPIDYYAKYLSRIRAVTLADVAECARRLMDPGRMTTVVVGDTDALREAASPSLRSRLRDISAEDQADSGRLPEERGA